MNRRLEIPAPKQPLVLVEREIPQPPPGGAVVKLHYSGICHSDVHNMDDECDLGRGKALIMSEIPAITFPMVLGHEMSGEIHALGSAVDSGVHKLVPGDRVMVFVIAGCRQCANCKEERYNLCTKVIDTAMGFSLPGGFQQFVAVPHVDMLIRVPDSLPMDVAALLPCSGGCSYSAVKKALQPVEAAIKMFGKASILIVGAGGLGLWGIQFARLLLPDVTEIIVAEASESKFNDALKAGADKTVLWPLNGTVDSNIAALKLLSPDGAAAVLDFVGASVPTSSAVGCLAQMGILILVGYHGGEMTISIPTFLMAQNQIKVQINSEIRELRELIPLIAKGQVHPPPITHVALEDAGKVLQELKAGKVRGRAVIKLVE